MIRKIIFICVALICKQDTLASVVMGSRPDFKDDADEVRVRLEIIPSGQKTGYGEIDPSGYEDPYFADEAITQLVRVLRACPERRLCISN